MDSIRKHLTILLLGVVVTLAVVSVSVDWMVGTFERGARSNKAATELPPSARDRGLSKRELRARSSAWAKAEIVKFLEAEKLEDVRVEEFVWSYAEQADWLVGLLSKDELVETVELVDEIDAELELSQVYVSRNELFYEPLAYRIGSELGSKGIELVGDFAVSYAEFFGYGWAKSEPTEMLAWMKSNLALHRLATAFESKEPLYFALQEISGDEDDSLIGDARKRGTSGFLGGFFAAISEQGLENFQRETTDFVEEFGLSLDDVRSHFTPSYQALLLGGEDWKSLYPTKSSMANDISLGRKISGDEKGSALTEQDRRTLVQTIVFVPQNRSSLIDFTVQDGSTIAAVAASLQAPFDKRYITRLKSEKFIENFKVLVVNYPNTVKRSGDSLLLHEGFTYRGLVADWAERGAIDRSMELQLTEFLDNRE